VRGRRGRSGAAAGRLLVAHDLADDEPIEEHADRRQVLLGRRCRVRACGSSA
jgi:hypothetical protein